MENFSTIDTESAMSEAGTLPKIKTPPVLAEAAYYGLAGEFVRALEPSTEADPAAILLQTLIAFGTACGSGPHLNLDGTRHSANEFGLIVGETSSARKGTSGNRVRETLGHADAEFYRDHVMSGLSSGEGLVFQIRDPIHQFNPKKQEMVLTDLGVTDKRLLMVEEEFGSVLRAIERDGNTLSMIVRQAWDSKKLGTKVKNNPISATNPHVSIIGQITLEELTNLMSSVECSNGFFNRFLWFFVRRSKLLPFGGEFSLAIEFGMRFQRTLEIAKGIGSFTMDDEFRALWIKVYPDISEGETGMAGRLRARSAPHARRVSMIYALIDGTDILTLEHLNAALAVIDFSNDSIDYIFGESTGDPIADRIMTALENGPISLTAISGLFDGHAHKGKIEKALNALASSGKIEVHINASTGGRPKTTIKKKGA